MPYLTLSQVERMDDTTPSFDFIVVGAGSAGCPLASRMSEDQNVTVLLVEAGPERHAFDTELNCQIPVAAGKLQYSSMDWQYFAATNACTHMHGGGRSFWPRGKGLGGCSLINYCAYVRGFAGDYNAWDGWLGGNSGWSANDMNAVFQRLENVDRQTVTRTNIKVCEKCRGTRGPLGISVKNPVNPMAQAFVQSAVSAGKGSTVQADYNCFCTDKETTQIAQSGNGGVVSLHQQTVRQGTRCHTARAYLEPILRHSRDGRPNLFILTSVRCVQVVTSKNEHGRLVATGVQVVPDSEASIQTTPTTTIHCRKEVILSAGALGSPQILLQSGIGPNGKTLHNPHVGQHLTDHLLTIVRFQPKSGNHFENVGTVNKSKAEGTLPRTTYNLWQTFLQGTGLMTSSAYDASLFWNSNTVICSQQPTSKTTATPDLQISAMVSLTDERFLTKCLGMDLDAFELTPDEAHPDAEGLVLVVTLLQPESRGSVTLASDNTNDNNNLSIDAGYFTDDKGEDMRRMVVAMRQALAVVQTGPLAEILSPVPFWPRDVIRAYSYTTQEQLTNPPDDGFLETYLRRYATTIYHPMSTCRMGTSIENSVVDARLRVWGVANLRIADASIAPMIVAGNTNAVCIAIGEKAALLLQEDHGLTSNPGKLERAVEEYETALKRARRCKAAAFVVLGTTGLVAATWIAARAIAKAVEKAVNRSWSAAC